MRKFICPKCESDSVTVKLKDYISHAFHDERCDEFLSCRCNRCGNSWKEKPSEEIKEQGE